jgi:hypothetical protein
MSSDTKYLVTRRRARPWHAPDIPSYSTLTKNQLQAFLAELVAERAQHEATLECLDMLPAELSDLKPLARSSGKYADAAAALELNTRKERGARLALSVFAAPIPP